MIVSVAGIFIGIEGPIPRWLRGFEQAGTPDLRLVIEDAREPTASSVAIERDGNRIRFRGRFARGVIDLDRARARVGVGEGERAVSGFLRVLLAVLLARTGGLLLHAAGVDRNGHGYAMLGPSGAGKTTIAGLAKASGARCLADEIVAVNGSETRPTIFATPFTSRGGDPVVQGFAPLDLICVLRQSDVPAFDSLPPPEVARSLLRRAVAPTEIVGGDRLLENAARIAASVPGGTLSFRRVPDFWDVLPVG